MDNPHPIYPSQTDTIKLRAKVFAEYIAKASNTKILSAFKRNDWLSQALGYKGHTDLIKSTEFCKQADLNQPLILFNDNALRLKIVDVFTQRTNISTEVITLCSKKIAEHEAIISNVHPAVHIPLLIDELSFHETPKLGLIREDMNANLPQKIKVPRLELDLSELPTKVYQVLCAHPMYRGFHFDETRNDVEISRKQPSSLRVTNEWKIRASFDVWSEADIPMDVLNDWVIFKSWLLRFSGAGRVHVWDRLKGHKKLQYGFQTLSPFKEADLYVEMNNDHDLNLLKVLLNHEKKSLIDDLVYFDPKADTSFFSYTQQALKTMLIGRKTNAILSSQLVEHKGKSPWPIARKNKKTN